MAVFTMTEANGSSTRRGPLPPVLFLGALLIQGAAHAFVPSAQVIPSSWDLLGVLIVIGGFAVVVVADQQFKRAGTTVKPFEDSTALVTSGVFTISRNPMYLGMVVMLFGVAIGLGSLVSLAVPLAFAWMLSVRFIRPEERRLAQLFGEQYNEYQRRVRRWL